VVEGTGLLDLTAVGSAEDLAHIRAIRGVGTVLVPASLLATLTAVPMEGVGAVVPVPDGLRANVHVGATVMDGQALADAGETPAALVVVGALVFTSPVERVGYQAIIVVGAVAAPRGSEAALTRAMSKVTGTTHYYSWSGAETVRVFQGDTRCRGDVLANPTGGPDDVAVVVGSMVLTSHVPRLGFREVVVIGTLIASDESEALLSPALTTLGRAIWYTAPPRLFTGKERFGRGFFELLDEPVTLVLTGSFEFDPDVEPAVLKRSVAGIALTGSARATRELVPLLQLLAVHQTGVIEAFDDDR